MSLGPGQRLQQCSLEEKFTGSTVREDIVYLSILVKFYDSSEPV
jgi:hypothetical protein